jgi:hypothetical protein
MAPSNKVQTADQDEAALLASLVGNDVDAGDDDEFAGADDLLNNVEEDDSEGWVPTEKGEGIVGRVVRLGETKSDFAKAGEDAMCPTVTIRTADGTKWRVIGYGAVLKRELADANAQIGDLMAVKYWGEKPIKNGPFKGKNYKHYSVVVQPVKKG